MHAFPHGVVVDASRERLVELRQILADATGEAWAFGYYDGRACFWFKEASSAMGFLILSSGRPISLSQ